MKRRTATDAVRDELVRVRATRACDRRAELAGLLRSAGTLQMHGSGRVGFEVSTEHVGVARRLVEALREATGERGEVRMLEPGRGHPHQRYVVRADEVSLQRLVEAGVLDESGAPSARVPRRVVAKRCCVGAYLRGAFIARGSVSDPMAGAHLEVRADDLGAAEELASLFVRIDAPARAREHRGYAAYIKTVAGVGAALAAMGAHDAYLRWESGEILKDVHVTASRLANADAANAKRLARAAVRQIDAIDVLDEHVGVRKLPRAVREMAELRREHPQSSLDELARLCDPPVTKGAAADRMRRLIAMAAEFEPDLARR